jgi:predicted ATPase
MQLQIRNIGTIEDAEIHLDGLTVVAGYNDTGKSTVGKLLFSIIKSLSRYEEDLEEDKESNTKRLLNRIYFSLRRKVSFREDINLRAMFRPAYFFDDIKTKGMDAVRERIEFLNDHDILTKIESNHINEKLDELINIISQSDEKQEVIKRAFKKIFYSEFENEVINRYKSEDEKSSIKIKELDNEILSIESTNLDDIELHLYDELYFIDATMIETPMVLNYSEAIEKSKSFFEIRNKKEILSSLGIANIAFHIKDLDLKLRESVYGENDNDLSKEISRIINGNMMYIPKEKEFKYIKKDGKSHKAINTATGIKSFGIIQMLVNGGFIDERSLLIIDEPEVHLHPEWQLKYAEIITALVKSGINVVITSHNPYMLEALYLYSKLNDIEKISNFYLAKDNKIMIQEDLSNIFETLAIPMRHLRELKMRESHVE